MLSQKDKYCLVIMKNSNDLQQIYAGSIIPAVKNQGLRCVRVDEIPGAGRQVKPTAISLFEAHVIIAANITIETPELLYILGLAHALGKRVVMLMNEDNKKEIPFDLSKNTISYTMGFGVENALRDEIEEAIVQTDRNQKSVNPISETLFKNNPPVSGEKYKSVLKEREALKLENKSRKHEIDQLHEQLDLLEQVKKENEELKEMKNFMEGVVEGIKAKTNDKSERNDPKGFFKQFFEELYAKGNITVEIPTASDRKKSGRDKIIFHKVSEK